MQQRRLLDPALPNHPDLRYLYARLTRLQASARGQLTFDVWCARWALHGVTTSPTQYFGQADLSEPCLNAMRWAMEMDVHYLRPQDEERVVDLTCQIEQRTGGKPISLVFEPLKKLSP